MPGSPLTQEQAAFALESLVEAGAECRQLELATHERAGAARTRNRSGDGISSWVCSRGLERAVVSEDRALELLQVVARLQPELVGQLAPSLLVALEGIGLPP